MREQDEMNAGTKRSFGKASSKGVLWILGRIHAKFTERILLPLGKQRSKIRLVGDQDEAIKPLRYDSCSDCALPSSESAISFREAPRIPERRCGMS